VSGDRARKTAPVNSPPLLAGQARPLGLLFLVVARINSATTSSKGHRAPAGFSESLRAQINSLAIGVAGLSGVWVRIGSQHKAELLLHH
jgi:hypothetical protein